MVRNLAILSVLVVILAAAFGSAAALGVTGGSIQAGEDMTLTCAAAASVAGWGLETSSGQVHNVRFSPLPAECNGNNLFIRVFDESGVAIARGNTVLDSSNTNSYRVAFRTLSGGGGGSEITLDASTIGGLKVWIEGPNGN
jgi:hypothetical protein